MDHSHWPTRLIALLSFCCITAFAAHAQTNALPSLYHTGFVFGYGCMSMRCFSFGGGMRHGTAVASVTRNIVSVQTRNRDNEWGSQQVLNNPDGADAGPFGEILALGDDIIMATGSSARHDNKDVVYVFVRKNRVWSHLQTLTLDVPAGYLGSYITDIVIDGSVAMIAATRYDTESDLTAHYLTHVDVFFRGANGVFRHTGHVQPPSGGKRLDSYSLAMNGSTAVIGNSTGGTTGVAYVYERTTSGWLLRKTLRPTDTTAASAFGTSVAVSGRTVAVGATNRPNPTAADQPGAIYMYDGSGSNWTPKQVLLPPRSAEPRYYPWEFARSIALQGARLIVTGDMETLGYLYERRAGTWGSVALLEGGDYASPGTAYLSHATAMINYTIIPYTYSSYVFELPALDAVNPSAN